MQPRPRIHIPWTRIDRILEFTGWVILIFMWVFLLVLYSSIPETVPVHFDISGHPDQVGNKATIFILLSISTFIYGTLTFLNRFPHIFNYLAEITPQNARKHYRRATKMIRYLKLWVVVLFSFITIKTIQIAMGNSDSLGKWFLPLVISFSIILALIAIMSSVRRVPSDEAQS